MSVQVRRRREAASFLSSYVGAQGELLVDTTNNRVQVHDGATPGGWPAAKLADVAQRTAVADASYTALVTDRLIAVTALTAARTVTLPSAAAYPTGTYLTIVDESGAASATNTITLARAGTDTINGATSAQIASAYGYIALESNGASRWTIIDSPAASAAAGTATTQQLTNRNALVNANFTVNQRAYASGAALAAGAYAHDRWKAGSGGCTYTFTQASPDTTITITAGTLIQAVDTPNVYATSYWLTWTGTATARVWQGSASGAYAAGSATTIGGVTVNALLVTGLSIGTVANVEFSTGTLGIAQFEAALPSAGPTRYERRHGEFALCQRYYQQIGGSVYQKIAYAAAFAASYVELFYVLPVAMRANPTMVFTGSYIATGAQGNLGFSASNIAVDSASTSAFALNCTTSAAGTASGAYIVQTGANGSFITISAEL